MDPDGYAATWQTERSKGERPPQRGKPGVPPQKRVTSTAERESPQEPSESDMGERVYSGAVSNGHYDLFRGGLRGKHDNVRTYWEDQIRGIKLRQCLPGMIDWKRKTGEKLRVTDLGAGTGEAYRLMTSWLRGEANLRLNQTTLLPEDMIEAYVGCDLSEAMVEQGNANFADKPNVFFRQGDFSKGFPLKDEEPFDLYFCSYGSFSHIDGEAMERLLLEIVEHAGKRALVVGEWLGRHSIEWPCYWGEEGDQMLDYSMSWLSAPNGGLEDVEHFPMRMWLGQEIRTLVKQVANKTKTKVKLLELYDCSIMVGRHVDTGEYCDWVSPVRSAVNRLHEDNVRTNLEQLKVNVVPVPGHDELNGYFANLQFCWNNLVEYCQKRLEGRHSPVRVKHWRSFPPILQMAIMTLDRVIDTVAWMRMGDPRANIIEPQLGYTLRNLELETQIGAGRGHSLVGVFEVRKG